ncbi:YgcG family protein [Methylacidimicrobium sp. B4]|uniref:TPM domain-containing protein n=1 Tax=Methylacidimicrobium sp. B4 TaxID=2796139 RepID=UPI001A8FA73F|nr:TPM domain-containing protein [Methylacidimicrobium sp. B4]QSR84821.1 TPM domain-containing protein [Methylacidimicrobium sp. B4]
MRAFPFGSIRWPLFALLWLGGSLLWAQVETEEPEAAAIPPFQSYVVDQARLLSGRERASLDRKLRLFAQQKGSQVAVLIVPTTRPESAESYGIRVVEQWKLGRKGIDDGVLLLIVTEERVVRLEVGYGLEGVIPDAAAKRIIEDRILPFFKKGLFFSGISVGLDAVLAKISGEPLPPLKAIPKAAPKSAEGADRGPILGGLFVLVMVVSSLFGPFLGAALAGGLGLLTGWALLGGFWIGLLVGLLAAGAALFLAGFLSGRGGPVAWREGRNFSGWGGWGGFGGDSGGFRGGQGGQFGGGGASGRW